MKHLSLILITLSLISCGLAKDKTWTKHQLLAFPGAEGYGRFSKGGRGGDVYHVTSLKDGGPGSFREGVYSAKGPRTIVFDVSGTISLKADFKIENKAFITIAGQTAPGDGITFRDHTFRIADSHDFIIRFIRVRLGDVTKTGDDVLTTNDIDNFMFDHISASWGVDGIHDLRREGNVTMQWCLYGNALHRSTHKEGPHGMLSSWRQPEANCTIHHNVFHSSRERHPTLGTTPSEGVIFDYRNNLNFNWQSDKGGTNIGRCQIDIINNYFKPGLSTDMKLKTALQIKDTEVDKAKGYVKGNYFGWNQDFNKDNYLAINYEKLFEEYHSTTRESFEVFTPFVTGDDVPFTHSAEEVYDIVLEHAGASLKRDAVDEMIIEGIKDGTNHLIDSQEEMGGWPDLKSLPAPPDTDQDGMPDEWERANGLDPEVQDNNGTDLSPEGYTNLEVYLNSLVTETYPD